MAEWTCVHHRQHVGDAFSGHLRAPGPCACLVVRAPTSLLTAQGRKANLWTEGCSTSFHGTVSWAPALLVTRLSETCRSKRLVQYVVDSNGCWFRNTTARWTCSAKPVPVWLACLAGRLGRGARICWISQGARCRGR